MRRRALAVSAVALALVAAAIVVASRHDGTPTGEDAQASDAGPAADSPPPTLAAPPAPAGPPRAGAASTAPAPHPTLRIRALADGHPAIGARIRVMSARTRGPNPPGYGDAIAVGDDGTIEIDATPALEKQSVTGSRRIEVQGLLDDWFATPTAVEVPAAADDGTPFVGSIGVGLSFRRAAVVVGRALAPDGLPVAASVQALRDEATPPEGTRTFGEGVVAGKDGRFRLVVDGEIDALLVVARTDARPATLALTLVRGQERDVGDVRLDRGASLAGRVRCGGVPTIRTTVIATWYGPGLDTARAAAPGQLWVIGHRAIWSRFAVEPAMDGRFRIDGLEPGPYRLRVPTEDWGCALHPDAYAEVDRIVRAPDERIDVDADRSLFQIDVVDETTVVGWPWIDVEGQDAITIEGEATGHVGVVLRAGARHRVTVRARGYAASALDVTAAEAGGRRRQTVSLTKARPGEPAASPPYAREGGVLRARVVGPDGVPFAVPFRLFDDQGTLLRAFARDPRAGALVRSATRTGVGELFTSFAPSDTKPPRGTVEVGGGLVETMRLNFDAVAEESDAGSPRVVVLHVR